MVNLLPRISPNRINEVLESIDGYKFITSSLNELDLSKKLELSRKRIYVVHTDSDEIIHITLSIDADNIYKKTKLFYIEYPEISCKPLFFRKTNSFALLGQEYFDGKPIDYCFDNGILNEDNVVKILKHINMVFDAKLKSSNHNEFIEEYENFTSSILNNVNINQFDKIFLNNYILPQLQKGLCEKNYYKRFSSGDLSAHNILVNNNCEFKVVDCEFANMTHLFCEDWFRLFTFSSDKFKKITYVRDLISNLNPFYLPFLYLRQTILNLDIHASSAYNHFLSSDLFNSLVSLYKTSNIDVIHSSFLLSGFFNHSSNSDTQVFELKNKNIQLTDDVNDLFEKLSNLEHEYNNINQKLTDEIQCHSDTKNTLKDFQDKLQAFKKENQSLLKKLNSCISELYLLKYKYNNQNITHKKQINKLDTKVNDISVELDIASDKIMRMQKSFSWRCTSILRFFRRKFKQYSSYFDILSSKPKHCSVPSQNSVDCTQTIPVSPSFLPYDLPVFNESSKNELFSPFSKNDKLVISWIIPDFGVGSGGHTNIFRIIYWLEKFGHKSIIWITGGSKHGSPEQAKNVINSHFFPIKSSIRYLQSVDDFDQDSDVLICTSFDTCYYGRSVKYFGKIFYFVQDYEPDFFPKGSFYYLAKSTYNFGFRCITNGQWMAQKVKEEGGNVVGWFQQAYDPLHYYHTNNCSVRSEINKSFKIAVYIRCATARRLSEMLILGLNELGKIRSDFHVIFFGDKHLPLIANFPHNIRDVLSHKQLGDLYRSCDIGCVFSGTNYSIIPIEMMACGLPIVEFDGDNTRSAFPVGTFSPASPNPSSISEAFNKLMTSTDLRNTQIDNALKFIASFDWENSARSVETALLNAD